MVRPPVVSSGVTPVELQVPVTPAWNFSGVAAAIQSGAFRAPDGTIGVVLTNIAPQSVSSPVRIDPATWGFTAGAPLTLTVRTEVGATVSTARITGPIDLPVTLSPLQVTVVALAPAG
jgi:hypothetical protein